MGPTAGQVSTQSFPEPVGTTRGVAPPESQATTPRCRQASGGSLLLREPELLDTSAERTFSPLDPEPPDQGVVACHLSVMTVRPDSVS